MSGVLVVLSHPDDESMGCGGLILRHSRAGIEVNLICLTRGEEGWGGKPPGATKKDLPRIRTKELDAAAVALGINECELWDYPDGGVEQSDQAEISVRIAEEIARLRPALVVGWGPDGAYGHPDHIATGRCTDAAVNSIPDARRPALYHLAVDDDVARFYRAALELNELDGGSLPLVVQQHVDVVFTLTPEEVQMKVRAIDCHQSQLEQWRVEIRNHPQLMQSGYGREPYIAIRSKSPALTERGLLGEFA